MKTAPKLTSDFRFGMRLAWQHAGRQAGRQSMVANNQQVYGLLSWACKTGNRIWLKPPNRPPSPHCPPRGSLITKCRQDFAALIARR